MDPSGFEPLTSCLQSRHSNQLNYGPSHYFVPGKIIVTNETSIPSSRLVTKSMPIKIIMIPINFHNNLEPPSVEMCCSAQPIVPKLFTSQSAFQVIKKPTTIKIKPRIILIFFSLFLLVDARGFEPRTSWM